MGQFKPMVKMMTTEPTVELKLKKGGHATMPKAKDGHKAGKKMMDGGVLGALARTPALIGRPAVNAVVRTPMKPSMSARRKAMMMGLKEGGETSKEHMAEMRMMKKTEKELKQHESMPASKAHKGLKKGGAAKMKAGGDCYATGGVAMGQGGYKKGGKVKMAEGGLSKSGIINTEDQGGAYHNTMMHTAEYTGKTSGKTGEVKNGNAGGYKKGGRCYAKGGGVEGNVSTTPPGKTNTMTGGVKLGNAGGYKKGGKAKKFADGGMSGSAPVTPRERQLATEILGPGYMSDEERRMYEKEIAKQMKPSNQMMEVERQVVRKVVPKETKKYATGGSVNDSGRPEKMPQGSKRPPTPVSINQLSGTYKKGGRVK
ncbi:hypothetical protein EBZ39_13115 [bacterium]|nr:hypothetical protein [bacterium]